MMDPARQIALAKALKSQPKLPSAEAGASNIPPVESNPPSSSPPLTTQTPNSLPILQTSNSPPTLQTPNSPPPITAVPLAVANTPATAPLDKGKGVLHISSEDEDSDVGPAYKRRRTNRIVYSRPHSPPHGGSLMDNPPNATSPPQQAVPDEGVVESAPLPTPTPPPVAPTRTPELLEIPPPIRQLMRGFNDKLSPGSFPGENRREGMPYYMGAFLAIALEWRA